MSEYHISSGTVSSGVAVSDYSAMYISSGGTADSTTINDNGKMYISPGGTANSTTINDNGNMFISSGGIASNTTINDKGTMHILSSGTADSTTVSSAGCIYISSGGTANNTSVYSCGHMYISSGGSANSVSVQSGARINVYGTVDSLALSAGGSMGGFIFAEDKYFEKIVDGSVSISESVILEGTKMDISSNGSVNKITVTDECQMFIHNGGSANSATISGGCVYLLSGGIADNTIFESAGDMYIYGGTANNAVIGHYGDMDVYFGGTANNTTLTTTGRISISSGGIANNTTFNDGGSMYIEFGGTANSNTLYHGWMTIYSGGTANDTTLKEHSEMKIELGGIANNTGVYYDIYLGVCGTANNTTVNSGGTMAISSGGAANNTTVDSRGTMAISSGGTANSTTVYNGGWMTISSGGSAEALTLSAGGLLGGFSYEKDKYFDNVSNGSAVIADNVHIIDSGMYILSGGTADSTFVNYGASMNISSGGSASNTTLNDSGTMYISSGAAADSTTVNSGGTMFISSGGTHRGSLQIAGDAVVSVEEGAVIDFSVAGRNADGEYLINDLSLIQGAPTYTITVDNDPTNGTYKLAQGAESFIETMVIGNGTNNYGTLTVNGNFCRYNGMIFFLDQLDGNLTLTIAGVEEEPIAIPSTTKLTNEVVTVSAAYSEDSIVKQYKIGENGQWVDYTQPFSVANNATIYFREKDAAGNETTISYVIDNIDTVADPSSDKYIFISSKYTDKINGKKQNGIALTYEENAFDSLEAAGDTSGRTVILLDGKNAVDYVVQGTVAGAAIVPTVKETENSHSYKAASAPEGTLNLTSNTGSTEFIRFAAVNVAGATVGNVTGGKRSISEDTKSAEDKKGVITDTEKFTYTEKGSGKFTAVNSEVGTVKGYSAVMLTNSQITDLQGGNIKNTANNKSVDGKTQDKKTSSSVSDNVAAGSVALKAGASADTISGFSNVTLSDYSTAGDITNFTSKDSKSESAAYDEVKNTVTRKVTITHTETTAGTLKATNSELGNVTGFATVTLQNVSGEADFRRVDANGNAYSTVKKTLNIKTNKDDSVTGTYNKTETFTRTGKFTATGSVVGDIENFSAVTLDGSSAGAISNTDTAKIVTQGTALWCDAADYGRPEDYDLNLDDMELTVTETKSLNGSVTLKNNAYAESISNFQSVSLTGSEVEKIDNVNKVTVSKGDSFIGSYTGTEGNDTLTIAQNAVLTASEIKLGTEAKDTLAINGTLILIGSADDLPLVESAKITGKGEIAANSAVYAQLDVNFANILDVGETSNNFRGTAYENADDNFKKAVKWDVKEEYKGWLGDWEGYTCGCDDVDYIRFKADSGDELIIDGIADDSWTLFDTRSNQIVNENIFADGEFKLAGEYILKLENSSDHKSTAYTITLA